MKKCPACAEYVKTEATKCKHCGSALAVDSTAVARENKAGQVIAAIAILLFGVALYYGVTWAVDQQADLSKPALVRP
jgi:hypothetical protein